MKRIDPESSWGGNQAAKAHGNLGRSRVGTHLRPAAAAASGRCWPPTTSSSSHVHRNRNLLYTLANPPGTPITLPPPPQIGRILHQQRQAAASGGVGRWRARADTEGVEGRLPRQLTRARRSPWCAGREGKGGAARWERGERERGLGNDLGLGHLSEPERGEGRGAARVRAQRSSAAAAADGERDCEFATVQRGVEWLPLPLPLLLRSPAPSFE